MLTWVDLDQRLVVVTDGVWCLLPGRQRFPGGGVEVVSLRSCQAGTCSPSNRMTDVRAGADAGGAVTVNVDVIYGQGWRRLDRFLGYHRPMLLPAHPIETPRLTLRPFTPGDFDDLYAYQSRPDVARYLRWDARDRAQARQALDRQCRETTLGAEGDWLTFAVVWRGAGKVAGEVGLKWLSREHRQGETGFVFNPDYHGRGLPPRRPKPCSRWGLTTWGGTGSPAAATPATIPQRA